MVSPRVMLESLRSHNSLRRAALVLALLNGIVVVIGLYLVGTIGASLIGRTIWAVVVIASGAVSWGFQVWLLALLIGTSPRSVQRGFGSPDTEAVAGVRRGGLVLLAALGAGLSAAGWIGLFISRPLQAWEAILSGGGLVTLGWAVGLLVPQRWRRTGIISLVVVTLWVGIVTAVLVILSMRLR
jgi:hypothetical protein